MIYWLWLLPAFLLGLCLGIYLGREEIRFHVNRYAKLCRELYDAREENATLTRMLHGEKRDLGEKEAK